MGYDIGCQSVFTDEDEQMLEEAKHRVGEIDPEVLKWYWESGAYARAEAGTEARVDELNRERAERVLQNLRALSSQEQPPQQKEGAPSPGRPENEVELKRRLTEQACALEFTADAVTRAMREAAAELKLGRTELLFSPVYVGAKGVSAEVVKEMTKEVMRLLVKAEQIPLAYRDKRSLDLVVFLDKPLKGIPGLQGQALSPRDKALPNTIFIYPDKDGQYPKGKDLLRVLAHELAHVNQPRFEKMQEEHAAEWREAEELQRDWWKTEDSIEEQRRGEEDYKRYALEVKGEFVPECFAAWVTAPQSLAPEMKVFFDKYHCSK